MDGVGQSVEEDQSLTVPADHFVTGCDFDAEEPYLKICANDSTGYDKEKKIPIPSAMAYYLRTHWCGSDKMHDLIESGAVSRARQELEDKHNKEIAALARLKIAEAEEMS